MTPEDIQVESLLSATPNENEQDTVPAQIRQDFLSRRAFVGTAAIAGASLISAAGAFAQSRSEKESGLTGDNASDPGPENKTLLALNPDPDQRHSSTEVVSGLPGCQT